MNTYSSRSARGLGKLCQPFGVVEVGFNLLGTRGRGKRGSKPAKSGCKSGVGGGQWLMIGSGTNSRRRRVTPKAQGRVRAAPGDTRNKVPHRKAVPHERRNEPKMVDRMFTTEWHRVAVRLCGNGIPGCLRDPGLWSRTALRSKAMVRPTRKRTDKRGLMEPRLKLFGLGCRKVIVLFW